MDQLTCEAIHYDSIANAFCPLQIDDVDYSFLFSDFGDTIEPSSATSQFDPLNLQRSPHHHPSNRAKSRVSLACITCRTRHTKCDAKLPVCSQCRETGRSCKYKPSRRGRKVETRQQFLRDDEEFEINRPRQRANSHSRSGSNGTLSDFAANSSSSSRQSPVNAITAQSSVASELDSPSKFIDLYYTSFHDAHPVVLPRQFLNQRLKTNKISLQYLLPVMEFVGSLFATDVEKEIRRDIAENALSSENLPATGFTVQALLIFAIAVHASNQFSYARQILDRGVQVALEIKMHSKSFATVNGEECSVLEESWRRTWWFLYLTDGSFAGIRHCLTFSLFNIETDVDLPCEESDYYSGIIPPPRTLEEYNDREFAVDELTFSSFAYLIDLGHIIGVIIALGTEPGDPFDPEIISADASLMNWALYLPKKKQLVVEDMGKVDEILFQAHMLCNTLKVYLHRPRSQLVYSPIERISKCAPPPCDKSITEQQRAYDFHTQKVLEASEAGIGLFTLPSPFIAHTPLVICGLTLSILAQISACNFKLQGPKYTAARDRVRLGLHVIKTLGEVWAIGHITVREIQKIARETLSVQRPTLVGTFDSNNTPVSGVEIT